MKRYIKHAFALAVGLLFLETLQAMEIKEITIYCRDDKKIKMSVAEIKKIPVLYQLVKAINSDEIVTSEIELKDYPLSVMKLIKAIIEGQDQKFFEDIKEATEKEIDDLRKDSFYKKMESIEAQVHGITLQKLKKIESIKQLKAPIILKESQNYTFNDYLLAAQFIMKYFQEPQTELLIDDIIDNYLFQANLLEDSQENIKKILWQDLKPFNNRIRQAFVSQYPESIKQTLLFSQKIEKPLNVKQILLIDADVPKVVIQEESGSKYDKNQSVYVLYFDQNENKVKKASLKIFTHSYCGKFFTNERQDAVFFSIYPNPYKYVEFLFSGLVYFNLKDINKQNDLIDPIKIKKTISVGKNRKGNQITRCGGGNLDTTAEIKNFEIQQNSDFCNSVSIITDSTTTHLVAYDQNRYIFCKRQGGLIESLEEKTTVLHRVNSFGSVHVRQELRPIVSISDVYYYKDSVTAKINDEFCVGKFYRTEKFNSVFFSEVRNYKFYKKLKDNTFVVWRADKNLVRATFDFNLKENSLVCDEKNPIVLEKNNNNDSGALTFCAASDDGSLVIAESESSLYYFFYDALTKKYIPIKKELSKGSKYFLGVSNKYIAKLDIENKLLSLFTMAPSNEEIIKKLFSVFENNNGSKLEGTMNYFSRISQFIKDKWRYLFGSGAVIAGISYAAYKYFKRGPSKDIAIAP